MDRFFHSVTLDKDKCLGCTNCIKRCPTEAIRVRGERPRSYPSGASTAANVSGYVLIMRKKARYDHLSVLEGWKYKIAIPAPALFGQFNNLDDIDIVLTGLKQMGFDDVYEVSRGAELVSDATRKLMADGRLPKPVISSACPAVVRLIRVRFPDLCDHVLNLNAPMEVSAMMAKRAASERTGIPIEEIGAFFITPCPAKVTDIKMPIGTEGSWCDGAIAISEVFPLLSHRMDKLETVEPIGQSGLIGVSWAGSGGESAALLNEKYLAADGIENVIRVLEELEDERIRELDFVELNACSGGCVGGVLCVENGYVAKARLQRLRKYLPVSQNHLDGGVPRDMEWTEPLEFAPVLKLSQNLEEAMQMMEEIDVICEGLPGLDCGSCGAPSCRALAEDVVRGAARTSDCVFVMREQVKNVADTLSSIGGYVPSYLDSKEKQGN